MIATSRTPTFTSGLAARWVRIGGMGKADLLAELQNAGVALNEAAHTLFADARFTTSATTSLIEIVELSVNSIAYPMGATFEQIVQRATNLGLLLCPLELGPHLRLQFLNQAEGFLGQPVTQRCAPPGSLTVASRPLSDDHDTPKGFYLRRINGVPWLRGYRSGAEHIWSSEDVLIFCRPHNAA